MTGIIKFGEFRVTKGATDDPSDIWIDIINFEFDGEGDYKEQVEIICDYIKAAFK